MGDDTLKQSVLDRFVAVNGDHPMTPEDDAYVREHFVPATPEAMALMLEDRLQVPTGQRVISHTVNSAINTQTVAPT